MIPIQTWKWFWKHPWSVKYQKWPRFSMHQRCCCMTLLYIVYSLSSLIISAHKIETTCGFHHNLEGSVNEHETTMSPWYGQTWGILTHTVWTQSNTQPWGRQIIRRRQPPTQKLEVGTKSTRVMNNRLPWDSVQTKTAYMLEPKRPQGDSLTSVSKQTKVGAKRYQEYYTTQSRVVPRVILMKPAGVILAIMQ